MFKKLGLVVMLSVMTSISYANNLFYPSHAPILCGEKPNVDEFLEYSGFKATEIGFGRSGGQYDGTPVFAVIIYKNKNETEMVATIETPDQMEKGVLFKLFDTTKAKTDKEKNE